MEGFLWFLVFGLLVYMMMRFGCGSHMVHGGHGAHDEHDSSDARGDHDIEMVKDPVCGMEVAQSEGYTKMYNGIRYSFCSRQCLDKFDGDPSLYLPGNSAAVKGDAR